MATISSPVAMATTQFTVVEGMIDIGRHEGISAAPEGGAALVALRQLVATGQVTPEHSVVLFNTGGALKYLDALDILR